MKLNGRTTFATNVAVVDGGAVVLGCDTDTSEEAAPESSSKSFQAPMEISFKPKTAKTSNDKNIDASKSSRISGLTTENGSSSNTPDSTNGKTMTASPRNDYQSSSSNGHEVWLPPAASSTSHQVSVEPPKELVQKQQRHTPTRALVLCDVQPVALNAIAETKRRALIDLWKLLVHAIESQAASSKRGGDWKIVYSGLQFSKDYREVPAHHKLYGAFRRLYEKTNKAYWFVESQAETKLMKFGNGDTGKVSTVEVWRSQHMPNTTALAQTLQGCTHATVVGIKTGHAIQATVQALCDLGLQVSTIKECIADDDDSRHKAVLEHLLPHYCHSITSISDWMDTVLSYNKTSSGRGGLDALQKIVNVKNRPLDDGPIGRPSDVSNARTSCNILDPMLRYFCDVGRGGHAFLYMRNLELLDNTTWAQYPKQPWYTSSDFLNQKLYYCPLGKAKLDFCDEPQFSKYSMYIKGREWLDEKDKLFELVPHLLPTTYIVKNQQFTTPPVSYDKEECIFVKECNKNGGKAVQVCGSLSHALAQCQPQTTYVVQTHIPNPLLTNSGKKCHVKSYFLLKEHGGEWILHMYPEAFLSMSEIPWAMDDWTPQAQVTIKRHVRVSKHDSTNEQWSGWPMAYEHAKKLVCQVVQTAVQQEKLQSRLSCSCQFELFSADVMIDVSGKAWLIECNFGCVLFDPTLGNQPLTTMGLREYQRQYDLHGKAAIVNDHEMLSDTVAYIFENGTCVEEAVADDTASTASATTSQTATTTGTSRTTRKSRMTKWEVIGRY